MKVEIGAYVTIITAIIVAFLAYRNQLRLRAFELFLSRRDSVLSNIEKFISRLYEAQTELQKDANSKLLAMYIREFNYEGEIIYHKAKGANFGETANSLLESFFSILHVPFHTPRERFDSLDWILRLTNTLTLCYGVAHRQVSREIESIAYTFWGNFRRKRLSRWRKVKIPNKANDSTNHRIQADAAEPRL